MPNCIHYWLIAPANGSAYSMGICRNCGERKQFANSVQMTVIGDRSGRSASPLRRYPVDSQNDDE